MFTPKSLTAFFCVVLLSLQAASPAQAAKAPRVPKSQIDRAIGRCVATVAIGALLGAAVGNNSGRGNAGRGAVIGAAAGGVVCAVILKVAKDKDALLAHQQEAVALGGMQRATFEGHDGPVTLITKSRDVEQPATSIGPVRVCRYAESQVELGTEQQADLGSQLYCRTEGGDWTIADASALSQG
ncbi:YMGG-like glycine zipper-containing protein [Caulobacter soli]|uniref:YMGG-like glycine zipper-containing protein n=1 Tax=Caulobacter soli TaxID=2708539 RepID=UPI0013ECBA6E|nr:YMGG-like glycine zipper-containing protein [Caulobacter soli]